MASSAETHKTMAAVMTEDLVKPLKTFAENQHKSRKNVESNVDKTSKILLVRQNINNTEKLFKCLILLLFCIPIHRRVRFFQDSSHISKIIPLIFSNPHDVNKYFCTYLPTRKWCSTKKHSRVFEKNVWVNLKNIKKI